MPNKNLPNFRAKYEYWTGFLYLENWYISALELHEFHGGTTTETFERAITKKREDTGFCPK